jgi:hypothetical protein
LYEQTPDEKPKYSIHPEGFAAWQEICQEVRMECVRFAWDNLQALQEHIDNLSRRFHSLTLAAETGNLTKYIQDFGLDASTENALRLRLRDLTDQCIRTAREQNRPVTREDLYKAFVIADDTTSPQRLYDGSKPFAAEIKQYLDLAYNANLSDALNGYLLTPNDTLPRVALQEWERAAKQTGMSGFTTSDIIRLARTQLFSHVQAGLYLKSMRLLSLQDVLEIRKTREWEAYAKSLDKLLKGNILDFEQQAPAIYRRYASLMRRITKMLQRRYKYIGLTDLTAPWDPIAELELDIAGAKLAIRWTDEGPACTFSGREKPDTPPHGSAPFIARLRIGEWSSSHTRADLFTSFDFMKGKLEAAQEQWTKLQADLKEILHGRERREDVVKIGPTLNEKAST